MADISIDEARARQWIEDVNVEIENVEAVLKRVAEVSTTVPGEDDVIMNSIESTCRALSDFWGTMCSGFKKASKSIANVVDTINNATEKILDDINSVHSRIGS